MRNTSFLHACRRRNIRQLGCEASWFSRTINNGRFIRRKQHLLPDVNSHFDDFGIPGVSVISNSQYGRLTKILCFTIITCIYVICIHQVSVRIRNYFQNPVSIDVVVEKHEYLHFPTVTICPWYPLRHNKKLFEMRRQYCVGCKGDYKIGKVNVLDLLFLPNISAQDIWDTAAINASNVKAIPMTSNEFLQDRLQIITQEVTTFMGSCLSVSFSQPLHYYGGSTGMVIDVTDSPNRFNWQYMIILHEVPKELPYSIITFAGISFHHNFETHITFTIKEYDYANTPTNPCHTPKDYRSCLTKCSERLILSLITCRLPYINANHLTDCITPHDARNTYNATLHVYKNIDVLCKMCNRPCSVTHYGLSMDCIKQRKTTRIKALVTNNFVERITETASYNFVMFFGDIGGTIGFFLGMCMINVVHMFTSFTVWMTGTLRNKLTRNKHSVLY